MIMATRIFHALANDLSSIVGVRVHVRHGHRMRGKPPTIARNLKQRLEELNKKDPETSFKVNIGLPVPKISRKEATSQIRLQRSDPELERQSRNRTLLIDLDKEKEVWMKSTAPSHIHKIAEHYGIFQDLYGDAYFMPVIPLEIDYLVQNDIYNRVYTGNVIKPVVAQESPVVNYTAEDDTLWTLVMSTPDGNMQKTSNEYCHWLIGNIPCNRTKDGEELIDYMTPIPPQGTGYFRYVFVLYKQTKRLDYAEYKKDRPCLELKNRDWNTLEFYRKYQEYLTPAGLAFFQADWDPSVKEFYHTKLDTKEPIFQYDFPKPYIKPQKWFPIREPFNLYLDKYRDPFEIKKEFLLRKLEKVNPFKVPEPAPKYPNAYNLDNDLPSWLKLEKKKSRLGWGRINDIK